MLLVVYNEPDISEDSSPCIELTNIVQLSLSVFPQHQDLMVY